MKPIYLLLAATMTSSVYAATPISKYMGEWNQSSKYKPGQVVTYSQASWLCISKQCLGVQPGTKPDAWITLGSNGQGVPGPQGPKGDTGPQGPQGPAGSGGGIRVYDANNQFLGYRLDSGNKNYRDLAEILVGVENKIATIHQGWDSVAGRSKVFEADIRSIFDDELFLTNDLGSDAGALGPFPNSTCSGAPAVPISSAEISNTIGKYRNQFGFITLTSIYSSKDMGSFLVNSYECNMGSASGIVVQNKPILTKSACITLPPNSPRRVSYVRVREINDICPPGFSLPCYECNKNEQGLYESQPYAAFNFTPMNLPFTLPIALPLRYEAQ